MNACHSQNMFFKETTYTKGTFLSIRPKRIEQTSYS